MSCKYILGNKEYTEQEILSYINDNKNVIVKENRIEKIDSVYINKDTADDSVLLHEYGHIFLNWAKTARPELYAKGIDLIKKELKKGDKSEIKDIFDFVKQTQPTLTGNALIEEYLTEFIGRESKNMMDEQKAKSPLMQWLSDFWASIKDMLGITSMTPEQVANLSLRDFARATVVDLLSGENFLGKQGEKNFEKWKGDNKLVQGSSIQEVKTGQPIVTKAYHGTTNEFYEFDASVKGSIEGHLGKVNYFTSDRQDANANYLSEGADIIGRIDRRQDELEDTLRYDYQSSEEGLNFQQIVDDFNITDEEVENLYPSGKPEFIQAEEISRFLAERELKGGTEQVLEVYVKLNNPVVLGNGSTWFDALDIDELYIEEATQEIADEYGITEQEAKDEYEWEIRDRAVEKQGDGNKIVEALERALAYNNYDYSQAFQILGDNYYETKVDLNQLEQDLRKAELYENYDGEIASSQVIADFFKFLGFDGIILTDVSKRFRNMGLSESTSHIHVFDDFNNQIKLSDGSNVTFGETPDIRYQKAIEPNLMFEDNDGNQYNSYRDAIRNSNNETVSLNIDGIKIAEVNLDTNIDTFNGTINSLVKEGLLSGNRILENDGSITYETQGETQVKKAINAFYAEERLMRSLGQTRVKMKSDGNFLLEDAIDKININGDILTKEQLLNLPYKEAVSKYGEATAIVILGEQTMNSNTDAFGAKKIIEEGVEFTPENKLQESLINLLQKLGIKITSIEDYKVSYKLRNGVEPSAQALADIANRVIAFKDGIITEADLTEEVMHFIVETMPESELENILRNIHKTKEWIEHSENYMRIYNNDETQVRREVLGKVMANAIINKSNQNSDNFVSKVWQFLSDFINRVQNYFKDSYVQELNDLTDKIYTNLLAGTLDNNLNIEQTIGNKYTMYSASNEIQSRIGKLQARAKTAVAFAEAQMGKTNKNDLQQRTDLNKSKQALEKVFRDNESKGIALQEAEAISVFAGVTAMVQKQLKYLERAVAKNKGKNYMFSTEEQLVYMALNNQMKGLLGEVRLLISEGKETYEGNIIKDEINKTIDAITNLSDRYRLIESDVIDNIANQVAKEKGLSVNQKEMLINDLKKRQNETAWLFTQFGNLVHARNTYLNIAAYINSRTVTQSELGHLDDGGTFLNRLKGKYENLSRFVRGNHIENIHDRVLLENDILEKELSIYNEMVKSNPEYFEDGSAVELTKEEYKKLKEKPFTSKGSNVFFEAVSDWKKDNISENPLLREDRIKRRDELSKYSDVTKDFEKVQSNRYAEIMQDVDYIGDVSVFNSDVKFGIEELKKDRANAKSPFVKGTLRKGFNIVEEGTAGSIKIGNVSVVLNSIASEEDVLAFELNQIDENKLADFKKKNANSTSGILTDKFKSIFLNMDNSDAYDFLMLNSYVGFSDEYYKQEVKEGLLDKLGDEHEDLKKDIRTYSAVISNVLKANRKLNSPNEINYENMSSEEIETVQKYQNLLQGLYSEAYRLIKKEESEEESVSIKENLFNDAFVDYMLANTQITVLDDVDATAEKIKDNPEYFNSVFKEVRKHLTSKDEINLMSLMSFINAKKDDIKIPQKGKYIFKKDVEYYKSLTEEDLEAELKAELLLYSYTRLMPYFKKTQPKGFSDPLNDLRSGIISPAEFVAKYERNELDFLKITPNFNFQTEKEVNKRFQNNKENRVPQIRVFKEGTTINDINGKNVRDLYNSGVLSKYVSLEYLEKYNIDLVELFETGKEVARSNKEDFDIRANFIELHKKTLDKYKMLDKHDLYLLPQKEKSKTRKATDTIAKIKSSGLKVFIEEQLNYREDEQETGDTEAPRGFGIYSVPKFGLRRLEQSEATDEILESYLWMNKQANLCRARIDNLGDMLALKDTLANATFDKNLEAEATRTYKLFNENINYMYYGIKENFSKELEVAGIKMNFGKILQTAKSIITFKSMGLNATVPITSFTTGLVNIGVEAIVGERLDRGALNKALSYFNKNYSKAAGEAFDIDTKSEMNVFGQVFGFSSFEERYHNSAYSKVTRGLLRSPFGLHTVADFPVSKVVGMSILYDHKLLVNDNGELEVTSFRDFKRNNASKTAEEIKNEWNKLKSLPDVMSIDRDGKFVWNVEEVKKMNNFTDEEVLEILNNRIVGVRDKVKLALQDIDSKIKPEDKSLIARNSALSFVLIFRNWLTLNLTKRTKSRHFNYASGQFESGSWITNIKFFKDIIMDFKEGKIGDYLSLVKKNWNNLDETEKMNVKRTGVDLAVVNLLALLVLAMGKELDDDDEDSYLFKLTSLIAFRTANEIASGTVALPQNLKNTLENSIVGLDSLTALGSLGGLITNNDIESGRYKGLDSRTKFIFKYLPLFREYNNLVRDIEGNIKGYRYYSFEEDKNLNYLTLYPYLKAEKKTKEN